MDSFQFGQENACQFTDLGGVAEIGLHKHFDPAPTTGIGISHRLGNGDLHVKGKLFGRAPREQVKMSAHRPQKILGVDEGLELFL